MGWSRPDEESRADYERDSVSAEWRPGDAPPLSAGKFKTALDIAALVKLIPIDQGADLIEAFSAAERERIRLDAVAAGAHP